MKNNITAQIVAQGNYNPMKYFLNALIIFFLISFPSILHAEVKVYFSPEGGCQEAVVTEINNARKSIDVGMYSFTSRQIAQALIDAKNRNIKIRIVLDKGQKKERYSKARYLITNGIDVKFHLASGLMHNKFAVIDGQEVLTGSFNWTASANMRNEENLLVITDKEISAKYEQRFDYLWSGSGDGDFTEESSNDKE